MRLRLPPRKIYNYNTVIRKTAHTYYFSVNVDVGFINLKTSRIKLFVTEIPRNEFLFHYALQCNLGVCFNPNIQPALHIFLLYRYYNRKEFHFENILYLKNDCTNALEIPWVIPCNSTFYG